MKPASRELRLNTFISTKSMGSQTLMHKATRTSTENRNMIDRVRRLL
jgi:hypothetical protein